MAKSTKPLEGSRAKTSGKSKPTQKIETVQKTTIPKLSWSQERFVEEYVDNGGNATQAYLHSHPGCSPASANVLGCRWLAKVNISMAIDEKRHSYAQMLNFDREKALRILVAMATASLDDFTPIFQDPENRKNYRGLGLKRMALESAKRTERFEAQGGKTITNEIKIISPSERRAVINDLWDKLGFDKTTSKSNWFDGFEQLAELVRGTQRKG